MLAPVYAEARSTRNFAIFGSMILHELRPNYPIELPGGFIDTESSCAPSRIQSGSLLRASRLLRGLHHMEGLLPRKSWHSTFKHDPPLKSMLVISRLFRGNYLSMVEAKSMLVAFPVFRGTYLSMIEAQRRKWLPGMSQDCNQGNQN